MKKILFKREQEEVSLIYCENISNLFDSVSTDINCCVIADKKVLDKHDSLREQIESKNFLLYEISNPEEEKNIDSYNEIINFLGSKSLRRNGLIIGLGGGAVTDLAGFVSSTYMRGLDYILIPTSLLLKLMLQLVVKLLLTIKK